MTRTTYAARSVALIGALALTLAACSSSSAGPSSTASGSSAPASAGGVVVGTLLPQTGSLAFLGPPEIAGVNLAIKDINDAGGVLGSKITVEHADSSDGDHAEVATQSVTDLISKKVQVIIGAASSTVTLNVIDDVTAAKIVQISGANTATKLSGYSPFYFRTAPPDTVQGAALGSLIVSDKVKKLGILVFNDDYGTSLRDVVVKTVEESGVAVTYGKSGQEFDPAASDFKNDVTAVLATQPDAVAIIAFDQTKQIIPDLVAAGFDASKLYLVDGNTSNYSKDFPAGTLKGAQGTIPGAFPTEEFQGRLKTIDPSLTDYSYAAESYDATILAALASVAGKGTDGVTIQKNMAAVSGANGGDECKSFKDCVALLNAGKAIQYKGQAGVGPFNAKNDPSSAYIGVYQYQDDNSYKFMKSLFGES
jgi:ABC-type branched-subunit amino acid transport system substrate-binding protein